MVHVCVLYRDDSALLSNPFDIRLLIQLQLGIYIDSLLEAFDSVSLGLVQTERDSKMSAEHNGHDTFKGEKWLRIHCVTPVQRDICMLFIHFK